MPKDYDVATSARPEQVRQIFGERRTIAVELRPNERAEARQIVRSLRELPGWDAVLLRTKPLIARPAIPRDLVGRVRLRTARSGAHPGASRRATARALP
jgi:hypothetical protein